MLSRAMRDLVLALAVIAGALSAGCGVESYRQRPPAPDLEIRWVATNGEDAEVLPRLSGDTSEMLAVERAVVVGAEEILHVRLLDGADGTRVIVIDLSDAGRARLEEASRDRIGRRLAIVADGRVIAAPTITTALTEGEAYVQVPASALSRAYDAMSAGD
jgi:preprotein translocase subunit SecD